MPPLNICPIHVPSLAILTLPPVLWFLLINPAGLLLPVLCHQRPPPLHPSTRHSPLTFSSPPLPLLLVFNAFPFNWLCFSSFFFFLLCWPVCLAFLLLRRSLSLFASQMPPSGSSSRPAFPSTGLLPGRRQTKLLPVSLILRKSGLFELEKVESYIRVVAPVKSVCVCSIEMGSWACTSH